MRRRPAADVSPDTPPFTTRYGRPAESILSWINAGNASCDSSPSPAVRLVPKNSTTWRGSGVRPRAASEARADSGVLTPWPPLPPAEGEFPRPQVNATQASADTIIRRMMIEARDLEQTYLSGGRPLTVLRQINLSIAPREFVAI